MMWSYRNLLVHCMAGQHRAGVAAVLALATIRGQTSAQVTTTLPVRARELTF